MYQDKNKDSTPTHACCGAMAASASRATTSSQEAERGPPGKKHVEGHREGMRAETPEGPLGRAAVEGDSGEEGGPGPPYNVFPFASISSVFLCSFLFGGVREKEIG